MSGFPASHSIDSIVKFHTQVRDVLFKILYMHRQLEYEFRKKQKEVKYRDFLYFVKQFNIQNDFIYLILRHVWEHEMFEELIRNGYGIADEMELHEKTGMDVGSKIYNEASSPIYFDWLLDNGKCVTCKDLEILKYFLRARLMFCVYTKQRIRNKCPFPVYVQGNVVVLEKFMLDLRAQIAQMQETLENFS